MVQAVRLVVAVAALAEVRAGDAGLEALAVFFEAVALAASTTLITGLLLWSASRAKLEPRPLCFRSADSRFWV